MRYNLAEKEQAEKAFDYLTVLNGRECEVDIKRVTKHRTLPQNSYLHMLLTLSGSYFGMTGEEMKTELKRTIYPAMFIYRKEIMLKDKSPLTKIYTRSTADLNSEEMTRVIDKLRTWSAEQGYALPDASDKDGVRYMENEVEKMEKYQ